MLDAAAGLRGGEGAEREEDEGAEREEDDLLDELEKKEKEGRE